MNARLCLALLLTAAALLAGSSSPVHARQIPGFGDEPSHDLVAAPFADREVTSLMAALDARLVAPESPARWADNARATLALFTTRLQARRLSGAQEASVLTHLDALGRSHPAEHGLFDAARHVVNALTVGKVAPDISGKDLTGYDLRLTDYRGKVVVVMFSGEWCGICRGQYPYERLLLELYKNWPFAILGVNSDRDPAGADRANAALGLNFRWWSDAGPDDGPHGPIASAWNVSGWPTSYLLDGSGVIRFVNLRQEDLLKGVRQLLTEQQTLTAAQHRR